MRFERVTEVEEEMRRIKESIGMQKKKKKKAEVWMEQKNEIRNKKNNR